LRQRLAVVQVPRVLPRLVKLPRADSREQHYVFLGELIGHYLADFFPARNSWLLAFPRDAQQRALRQRGGGGRLLKAGRKRIAKPPPGDAVRLEVEQGCPLEIRAQLLENLGLDEDDLFVIDGPLNPIRLMAVARGTIPRNCATRRLSRRWPAALREDRISSRPSAAATCCCIIPTRISAAWWIFSTGRADPNVLAIKQTLYRTGGDLQIVGALMDAVRNGKQVTAVVELKGPLRRSQQHPWARRWRRPACMSSMAWSAAKFTPKCAWWCARMTTPSGATCI
jgi:polyphosphate kinase